MDYCYHCSMVCLLVKSISCAKTTRLRCCLGCILMGPMDPPYTRGTFGGGTYLGCPWSYIFSWGPWNHALGGSPDSPWERGLLGGHTWDAHGLYSQHYSLGGRSDVACGCQSNVANCWQSVCQKGYSLRCARGAMDILFQLICKYRLMCESYFCSSMYHIL